MKHNKDPLILNKIVASLLVGGLVIMGSGYLVDILYHTSIPEKPAYFIEPLDTSQTTAKQEPEFPPLNERLRVVSSLDGDSIKRGKVLFKKCKSCHTTNKGGKNGVGPNLWNVVAHEAGQKQSFKYSRNISEVGDWSFDKLDKFIEKPSAFLKGTKMSFAGIKHPMQRASVLLYLNSLSDTPAPLPVDGSDGGADK